LQALARMSTRRVYRSRVLPIDHVENRMREAVESIAGISQTQIQTSTICISSSISINQYKRRMGINTSLFCYFYTKDGADQPVGKREMVMSTNLENVQLYRSAWTNMVATG